MRHTKPLGFALVAPAPRTVADDNSLEFGVPLLQPLDESEESIDPFLRPDPDREQPRFGVARAGCGIEVIGVDDVGQHPHTV